MANKTKKMMISFIGLFAIFILAITWFYPFSMFSIYKNYSFTPDPVVVDEYVRDLSEFKISYEKDLEESTTEEYIDFTTDRTQYILPLFEQDWLVSKEPIKMSMKDLSNILFEVKNIRNSLLGFLAKEDYPEEQRQYLINSIKSILSLEEDIVSIKTGKAESRKTLKIQVGNLHTSFIDNFMMFEIFYDSIRNE